MRTSTFFILFFFCALAYSQNYSVKLKVVDQSKGSVTNKADDQNEVNIYCWIDDNLQKANPRTPSDWWYPMYADGQVNPKGELLKGENDWTWQLDIQVPAGENYEWCPGAKTWGWKSINSGMYHYSDTGDNLVFSVSSTGEVSGQTILTIPDPTATALGNVNKNRCMVYLDSDSKELTIGGNYPAAIRIFDATGTLVKSENKISPTHIISMQQVPSGIYFIAVECASSTKTYKVIK